jgi:predicted phosphodiesterase
MRVFAVSDLHVDYKPNREWLGQLSTSDFQDDALILAGDISDKLSLIDECFATLVKRFCSVLFVPGNHDLWIDREDARDSFEKYIAVKHLAAQHGVRLNTLRRNALAIVPLLGWYDYSFGPADDFLRNAWVDYRACRWPEGYDDAAITRFFTERNATPDSAELQGADTIITFSHFLPRIDLMPERIPPRHRKIYPVLGTSILERQLRQLGSSIHVYGHSHVNRHVAIDDVTYINNAFGYPTEAHVTARRLVNVHSDQP